MAAPFYVYDLLASESFARWGADAPLGSPVTITYSFPAAQPSSTSYGNFTAFTTTEIAAARAALAYIGSLTKITFVETSSTDAELQFGNADVGSGVSGRATYNYNTNTGIQNATVVLSNTGDASLADSDFIPGSITANDIGGHGWGTLLHEIGHALGLKHSFERNIAQDPNSILPSNLDDLAHTVMSYTPYQPSNVAIVTGTASGYTYYTSNLAPQTYSLYDIAALQYLYGTPAASSGNKVFTFAPDAPILTTLYATGPNNTIDCSALTGPSQIDLNAGATSHLAIKQSLPFGITLENQYDGSSAVTLAYGCVIANAIGGSGIDSITGNAAANSLDGRGGGDMMTGLGGNDLYYVDSADDRVIEVANAGADRVLTNTGYTLGAGQSIELFTTWNDSTTFAVNLTGNELAQTIKGNFGANVINGGGGTDILQGLGGNDLYYVDSADDRVIEVANAGADRVLTNTGYTLGAGQSIELFTTWNDGTTFAVNLTGNELAQTIKGNFGANVINGGGGTDILQGLGGNDLYYVDSADDRVIEVANAGADRVLTNTNYTLGAGQSIELFTTWNDSTTFAVNLTGNELAQTIKGNGGANVINGGLGNDTLTGLGGADTFAFKTALGSGNVDHITDFSHAADTIQLGKSVFAALGIGPLTEAAFKDLGVSGAMLDSSDRILYNHNTGALGYDADGSGSGSALVQFAILDTKPTDLAFNDFLIVA